MNQHNFFMKLLDTGLPATRSVFFHRQPRPLFLRPAIRRLTSGHLSAAADEPRRVYCASFGEYCKPWLDIKL